MDSKSDNEVTSRLNDFCHEARHTETITGAMTRKVIRLYDTGPLANKKEIKRILREINKQLTTFASFVEEFRYSCGIELSKNDDMKKLLEMIIRHEGLRLKPYVDTVGKVTIGYGRNLSDNGISEREAKILLMNDIRKSCKIVESIFGKEVIDRLSDNRYRCLVDMAFNLGYSKFKAFKKMIRAVKKEDYIKASREMLDSRWATQVKSRAKELAKIMLDG